MLALLIVGTLWFAGFLFLYRVPSCREDPARTERPAVSVIIPARNEEANLPVLLDSLKEQEESPFEIIVVDDESKDRTAEWAAERGANVLRSEPLPDGWRGKTWACHQGAQTARGELLLFVDADTRFEPGGFRRLVDTYLERPGALSVAPYHVVRKLHEQFSAFFNLMMLAGIGAFTILGTRAKKTALFGQVMLVDRDAYFRAGGHEAVRGHILENVYLARRFAEQDTALQNRGGRGTVTMRMYPVSLRELAAGWGKAFASGADQTPPLLMTLIALWISGCILTMGFLVYSLTVFGPQLVLTWCSVYLLYAAQIASMLNRIGSFHPLTSLFFPFPLLFYIVIFTFSAFTKQTSWKGRSINLSGGGEG